MFLKACLLLALVHLCMCRPQEEPGMPYDFEWSVDDAESGNQYSHRQSSDGTVTQGEYRVLLPDTRLMIVTFQDNGNGFEPVVTFEGEAVYDSRKK